MVWRPGRHQKRLVVGTLSTVGDQPIFRYDGDDLPAAFRLGFLGYPGIRLETFEHNGNAAKTFLSRLARRERPDYSALVEAWGVLPQETNQMFLLAATGGLLPTDMFEFLPVICPQEDSEFLSPVAGLGFTKGTTLLDGMSPGGNLTLAGDPENAHDSNAVSVLWQGMHVGFVKRIHCDAILRAGVMGLRSDASIERVSIQAAELVARIKFRKISGAVDRRELGLDLLSVGFVA